VLAVLNHYIVLQQRICFWCCFHSWFYSWLWLHGLSWAHQPTLNNLALTTRAWLQGRKKVF
jgi:hypothetical protein